MRKEGVDMPRNKLFLARFELMEAPMKLGVACIFLYHFSLAWTGPLNELCVR